MRRHDDDRREVQMMCEHDYNPAEVVSAFVRAQFAAILRHVMIHVPQERKTSKFFLFFVRSTNLMSHQTDSRRNLSTLSQTDNFTSIPLASQASFKTRTNKH